MEINKNNGTFILGRAHYCIDGPFSDYVYGGSKGF
jgi:hypothetical protein